MEHLIYLISVKMVYFSFVFWFFFRFFTKNSWWQAFHAQRSERDLKNWEIVMKFVTAWRVTTLCLMFLIMPDTQLTVVM